MPRLANAFTDIQLRHLKKEGITALGGVQGLWQKDVYLSLYIPKEKA